MKTEDFSIPAGYCGHTLKTMKSMNAETIRLILLRVKMATGVQYNIIAVDVIELNMFILLLT